MTRTTMRQLAAFLGLLAIGSGCSEIAAPPAAPSPSEATRPDLARRSRAEGQEWVSVLARTWPLRGGHRAEAVIGPDGGEIEIREAGFLMRVPAGALDAPVMITVTARRGYSVAYEFGPHGLQFKVPVQIRQDLRRTTAAYSSRVRNSLVAGYFENGSTAIDEAAGAAAVSEIMNTRLTLDRLRLMFDITHFSGYLVATGRSARTSP